jgi:uncharacterized protein YgiM (DUF1202 family)
VSLVGLIYFLSSGAFFISHFAFPLTNNFKTMKSTIVTALAVSAMLWSCQTKENTMLKGKIDSLNSVVEENGKTFTLLGEVGAMLDSIEHNRMFLNAGVLEPTNQVNYIDRLKNLNAYVQATENKLVELESKVKKNSGYASMVQKLTTELTGAKEQIAALQVDVERANEKNMLLTKTISQKDSLLVATHEVVKSKEQDIAGLETKVQENNKTSISTQADLYYAQGQALELAAARTKFAPRKRKETKREALELYKRAYSLGKADSKQKIEALEKELS